MKKNVQALILSLVIISLTAILLFLVTHKFNIYRALESKKVDEPKGSLDLQSLVRSEILEPKPETERLIIRHFAERGEYKTARSLNRIFQEDKASQIITETSLWNKDYAVAKSSLAEIRDSDARAELQSLYYVFANNKTPQSISNPRTETAKLINCIITGDYSTLPGDNQLALQLIKVQEASRGEISKKLATASVLADHSYYQLASSALSTLAPESCNTDYFLISSRVKEKLAGPEEALDYIAMGIQCDPSNIELLSSAVVYGRSAGRTSDVSRYQNRINTIHKLEGN